MKKLMALVGMAGTLLLASCGGGGGSAGNTGQTNALRMNPALTSVGMRVGFFADVTKVSAGVQPYFVLSSDPSVQPVLLDDGTLRLIALQAGTSTVAIQDSTIPNASLSFTVNVEQIPIVSSVGSAMTMVPGQARQLGVSGGIGPYTVVSADESIATVAGSSGSSSGTYVVTAHLPGNTTLTVTDAVGTTFPIDVTVSVDALTATPSSGTGVVGTSLVMVVSGGVGPYTAVAANPSIATATVNNGTVTVQLAAVGSTVVTVRDSLGKTLEINVSATASQLSITPASRSISEKEGGGVVAYALSGKAPPFNVLISTADSRYVTSAAVSADNQILTVNLASSLCLQGGDRPVQMVVTDRFGTSSIATLTIVDQGKDDTGAEIPCP